MSLPPPPISSLLMKNAFGNVRKVEKFEFTDTKLSIEDMLGKSPTVIMRNIDAFRMYNPLESEREKYNLPEGRMNLSTLQHVMYLCGAYVGLRFTSEDMNEMTQSAKGIEQSYNRVNAQFATLSPASKKYGCTRSMLKLDKDEDAKKEDAADNCVNIDHLTASTASVVVDTLPVPPAPIPSSSAAPVTSPISIPAPVTAPVTGPTQTALPTLTDEELAATASFAALACEFMESLKELQCFMKYKQRECAEMRAKVGDSKLVISKDPDGLSSSSKPFWLETLLAKFQAHLDARHAEALEAYNVTVAAAAAAAAASEVGGELQLSAAGEQNPVPISKPKPVMLSVGKFSKYLGDAVCANEHQSASWSDAEKASIQELICASIDSVTIFGEDAFGGLAAVSKEYYYAKRFFNFISVLSEMKSVPKDEKFIPVA